MKMKKIKPIGWLIIALLVYFMFFHETETIIHEPDNENGNGEAQGRFANNPLMNTDRKKCGGKKCTAVRRRGFLGIGRRVAKDYCSFTGSGCTCLGDPC